MSEIKNAIIIDTFLGYEDHGILTFYITLDYGGVHQAFGGIGLDRWDEETRKRHAEPILSHCVSEIINAVGVGSWEKLKGEHVRADTEFNKIHAIGHIIEDKWFNLTEFLETFKSFDKL